MNQQRLNPYHLRGFACDKCGNEYYDETAYSPAPSLNEINDYHTYCVNCVLFILSVEVLFSMLFRHSTNKVTPGITSLFFPRDGKYCAQIL